MIQKLIITFLFIPVFFSAVAQTDDHDHTHDHEHEHKHLHNHEIGLSVGPAWFLNEGETSAAIHLHYVYNFPETKFGLGLGYERIFDDHKHNFIGVELNYRPIHPLTLNLSPGLAFEGEHNEGSEFAMHFETVYEFEMGKFHIGPMIEVAYHPEDWHFSLGIHLGLGF